MIDIKSVMENKIKQKLLVNQANEISTQFHDIVSILEKELDMQDCSSHSSDNYETSHVVIKNLLFSSNKLYNDFLFIKNMFEIDCGDLRPEIEPFYIKDFFLYSIDLLLSRTQNRNIKISIDPCLPDEVEGDLLKFRQIITSILDFSLKSTQEIDVELHANFVIASGEIWVDFKISFTPKFELKEKELKLLFSNDEASACKF